MGVCVCVYTHISYIWHMYLYAKYIKFTQCEILGLWKGHVANGTFLQYSQNRERKL